MVNTNLMALFPSIEIRQVREAAMVKLLLAIGAVLAVTVSRTGKFV